MEKFHCKWEWTGENALKIQGCINQELDWTALRRFDCGESGSTLRFLIPIALALSGGGEFTGHGRLMERPQEPYFQIFDKQGIFHILEDEVLTVQGDLKPGEYRLPGNISSQFFTGLLMALPLLNAPSIVASTTRLESADYVTMTMGVLEQAGVPVRYAKEINSFAVRPSVYQPFDVTVEADWSQAAFWYAALALGNSVQIRGLDIQSYQGDKVVSTHAGTLSAPGDAVIDLSRPPAAFGGHGGGTAGRYAVYQRGPPAAEGKRPPDYRPGNAGSPGLRRGGGPGFARRSRRIGSYRRRGERSQ